VASSDRVTAGPTAVQRELARRISEAAHCVALTGAGISTPSGIPDFRSPGGLWSHVDPMTVAHIDVWRADPERFWSFYRDRLDLPDRYEPNAAHYALVALQRRGLLDGLITQNIDGLHQKAGAREVIELHGSVRTLVCPCGAEFPRSEARDLFRADGVPYCPRCARPGEPGQALKPDVVLFGEMLPLAAIERAQELADRCDLMLCIGSSLTVHPAADLPAAVVRGGGSLAVVAHETAFDDVADLRLAGDVADEMAGVIAALDELAG
jgi:NAD-dependent deacetylase